MSVPLRITYGDRSSSFENLLKKENSVSIHHRNIQALANGHGVKVGSGSRDTGPRNPGTRDPVLPPQSLKFDSGVP